MACRVIEFYAVRYWYRKYKNIRNELKEAKKQKIEYENSKKKRIKNPEYKIKKEYNKYGIEEMNHKIHHYDHLWKTKMKILVGMMINIRHRYKNVFEY